MIAITSRSSTRVKPTREAAVEQRGPERWGRDEGDMVQAFGNALTKRQGTPPEKRVQGFCEGSMRPRYWKSPSESGGGGVPPDQNEYAAGPVALIPFDVRSLP